MAAAPSMRMNTMLAAQEPPPGPGRLCCQRVQQRRLAHVGAPHQSDLGHRGGHVPGAGIRRHEAQRQRPGHPIRLREWLCRRALPQLVSAGARGTSRWCGRPPGRGAAPHRPGGSAALSEPLVGSVDTSHRPSHRGRNGRPVGLDRGLAQLVGGCVVDQAAAVEEGNVLAELAPEVEAGAGRLAHRQGGVGQDQPVEQLRVLRRQPQADEAAPVLAEQVGGNSRGSITYPRCL